MFFKKLFSKDYRHYFEKGEKLYADEKYAEARLELQEALQKINNDPGELDPAEAQIRSLLADTCNRLALLNISEAEHALARKDLSRAAEHLSLAEELANDTAIKDNITHVKWKLAPEPPSEEKPAVASGCAGCSTAAHEVSQTDLIPDHLTDEERFELLVHTLPASLQKRYTALGETFIKGYLLLHSGDEAAGLDILQTLLNESDNDILLYEVALSHFRAGDKAGCERLLRKAYEIDSLNPLCCLGLVQLLTDTGRLEESIPVLHHMIDNNLLTEQSLLFLGDVSHELGDDAASIESYSKALTYPNAAKTAAERMIPLLERQGRTGEVTYLAQRYLKGCC